MVSLSSPDRIGRYRILGVIGRGGMGVVYRAVRDDGASVALKVMAPEVAHDDRIRQRFERESALSIEHPNVVPIYEAGIEGDHLYLAMYLVEGQDLKKLIRAEGRLLPARVLTILRQAAEALDAAHLEGLVHRDVKPQNFLLEGGAAKETVYLSDFGLVKRVAGQTSLTGAAHLVGTAHYMSPEQIKGAHVDGRTDVYALGCVLYECLTGSVPFTAEEEVAALWSHVNDPPPRASRMVPVLPEAFDDVVARAMAKDPDDRYLTAGDLADAFEETVAPGSGSRRLWASPRTSPVRSGSAERSPKEDAGRTPARAPIGAWLAAGIATALVLVFALALGRPELPLVEDLPALLDQGGSDPTATSRPGADGRPAGRNEGAPDAGSRGKSKLVAALRDDLPKTLPPAKTDRFFGSQEDASGIGSGAKNVAVAPHPASGTYVYSQAGHEQICPTGRGCLAGSDLPDEQSVRVGQTGLSRNPLVVSSGAVSDSFALGTLLRYRANEVRLRDLQMSFDTDFGSFRVELTPDPAPDWLVFPAVVGRKWRGTWTSDSPGNYEVEISDSGVIRIAGRRVDALQIRTFLSWGGAHPGSLEATSWIARTSREVLETAVHVRVTTNVDDHHYDVTYTRRLTRGPGYDA